jgi:hypothetical protein
MEAAGIRFTVEGVAGGAGGSNELISRSQSAIRRYHTFYAMGVQTSFFRSNILPYCISLGQYEHKNLGSNPAPGTNICPRISL